MVVIVSTTRFPVSKAKEVGQRYTEVAKKYPPDRSLEKVMVRMVARIIDDEIETIGVTEVKEGKYEEVLKRATEQQLLYADIEGMKFKVDTFFSGVEAMPMVGLEMPE
ncbi:MAG: hypothetical protein ACFFCV_22380 [Promethearchaeota archaeon]